MISKIPKNLEQIEVKYALAILDLLALLEQENEIKKPFNFEAKELITEEILIENLSRHPIPTREQFHYLGKYTEALMAYFFRVCKNHQLLISNLQINEEGISKGEIDFILLNKQKEYVHLEYSTKFFLQLKDAENVQWLGPNGKDSLKKKKEKLINQQLRLCSNYHHLLKENLKDKKIIPKALLHMFAFFPFESTIKKWWIRQNKTNQLLESSAYFSIAHSKLKWLNPCLGTNLLCDVDELENHIDQHFRKDQKAILVVRYDENKEPMDHGFIVNNTWPSSN